MKNLINIIFNLKNRQNNYGMKVLKLKNLNCISTYNHSPYQSLQTFVWEPNAPLLVSAKGS